MASGDAGASGISGLESGDGDLRVFGGLHHYNQCLACHPGMKAPRYRY